MKQFGKIVQSLGIAQLGGGRTDAASVAAAKGWHDTAAHFKAAVGTIGTGGGFTLSDGVAQEFVGDLPRNSLSAQLNEATRSYGLHNRVIVTDNEGLVAEEVGEGQPIPVAGLAATSITITPSKCGIIIPYTEELIRSSNCADVIEADARLALARGLDAAILSRLVPGSAGGIAATSDAWADVRKLFSALALTGQVSPLLAASVDVAILMATLRSSGQATFPEMSPSGGHVGGAPVFASDRLAAESLLAVDPQSVAMTLAGVEVALSRQAAVQMNTAPTNSAAPATGSTMVSPFQSFAIMLKLTVAFSIDLLRGERVSETIDSIAWANS